MTVHPVYPSERALADEFAAYAAECLEWAEASLPLFNEALRNYEETP